MPKLKAELLIDLTPEQTELTQQFFDELDGKGGMILGSLYRFRDGSPDFKIRVTCGFRVVDNQTALKLIELANAQGENKDV